MGQLWRTIATLGPLGLIPKAPGTFGSLGGLAFCWVCWLVLPMSLPVMGIIVLSLCAVLGWYAIAHYELSTGKHDAKQIVVDELVGQALVVIWFTPQSWTYLGGFLLFRFFDIFKFGPVRWADQRLTGPVGTLLDDIFAGFIALVCLLAIKFYADELADLLF